MGMDEETVMQLKQGDRFSFLDAQGGLRYGIVQCDMDDTDPRWPMVQVLRRKGVSGER